MEKVFEKINVVYAGKRLSANDKLFVIFYILNEDGSIGNKLSFDKTKYQYSVGLVYEIEADEDRNIFKLGNPVYKGLHKNEKEVKEFSILHKTAQETVNFKKKMKNLSDKYSLLETTIKPLREISREMSKQERQSLVSYLIEMIL